MGIQSYSPQAREVRDRGSKNTAADGLAIRGGVRYAHGVKRLSQKQIENFQQIVWEFYHIHKRETLPWRKSITPYKIVVSEVMLQQTQVDRVIPFFKKWMTQFSSWRKLAHASQSEVLRAWKGLGYNSRALRLHRLSKIVVDDLGGKLPQTRKGLENLPGIGPYTAGAIQVFVYGEPEVLIETNIRTVYLYHFLKNKKDVHDEDLKKLVEQTVDQENPREWYWALMDYGSYLKRKGVKLNQQSKHYIKQSKFLGSDRQLRGAVLDMLLNHSKLSHEKIVKELTIRLKKEQEKDRVLHILEILIQEGFIAKRGNYYSLV